MTLRELNAFLDIKALYEYHTEKLDDLRSRTQPGAQAFNGMPRASGYSDKLGTLVPQIIEEEKRLEALCQHYKEEKERIKLFIDSIPDHHTYTVFYFRFVVGMSWQEVADTIGGKNTGPGVKQICYRYLNNF